MAKTKLPFLFIKLKYLIDERYTLDYHKTPRITKTFISITGMIIKMS